MKEYTLWSGELKKKFIDMGPMGYSFDDSPSELLVFSNKVNILLESFLGKRVQILIKEEEKGEG